MHVIPEEMAQQIFRKTRAFFKGDVKSFNKLYTDDTEGDLPLPTSEKVWDRWSNQLTAKSAVEKYRKENKGETLLQYGQALHAMRQGERAGNCLEMACVAMAIAVESAVPKECQFLGAITDPGDHCFLVINAQKPAWKTVREMTARAAGSWVIDPWSRTCCSGEYYQAAFCAMLARWTRQGKRIRVESKHHDFRGWSAPTDLIYMRGFQEGPLAFYGITSTTFG